MGMHSLLAGLFVTLVLATDPSVTIDAGEIIGTQVALPKATVLVNEFLGIPFAQSPPVRFSPPVAPRPWGRPLKTQAWKPAYPEASRNFTRALFNPSNPEESEDCLYLNVYAPASPPPKGGRAVLFWLYGGSLAFGTAGQPIYSGSNLAAYEDVIVVSTNYRTNVFGFPWSPELPLEGRNLGFLDQRAGLQWVQRNIGSFGGDPAKVTIFGESAGGSSVDALLTSYGPNSNPPFRAGIMQSGQLSYRPSALPSDPYRSWNTLASSLNCTTGRTLQCLRAVSAATIKNTIERQALSFSAQPDNYTVVSDPARRRLAGEIKKLPILTGTNSNEGGSYTVSVTNLTAFFNQYLSAAPLLWPVLEVAYAEYGPDPSDVAAAIITEYNFQCPQVLLASASAKVGIPTWRYYFNATGGTEPFPGAGAMHSAEIQWVYSTYPPETATSQQVTLSNYMRGAWADFAKNPYKGPGWIELGTAETYGAPADEDLALLGDVGSVKTGGATLIRESALDSRCAIFKPIYDLFSGLG